jgi:hypothetical protein
MSRIVRHGEQVIPIVVPIFTLIINGDDEEVQTLVGFKTDFVIDKSQMDGDT